MSRDAGDRAYQVDQQPVAVGRRRSPQQCLGDDRSAAEVVLAGLSREPVTTFAAVDDPWILHARLDAEREEHLGVLRRLPPDLRISLGQARAAAEWAGAALQSASADLDEGRQRRLVRLGFPPGDAASLSALHARNFM